MFYRHPPYVLGTPHLCLGHHMCVGVIQMCQEYHRRVRTTTYLSGKLFRLVGDTTDVSATTDMCQVNKRHFGDNTYNVSETPLKC